MQEIYNPETDPTTFVPEQNQPFYYISPTFKIVGGIYDKELHAQLVIAGNAFEFFEHVQQAIAAMLTALGAVNKQSKTFKRSKPDMKLELMAAEKLKVDNKSKKSTNKKKK